MSWVDPASSINSGVVVSCGVPPGLATRFAVSQSTASATNRPTRYSRAPPDTHGPSTPAPYNQPNTNACSTRLGAVTAQHLRGHRDEVRPTQIQPAVTAPP